MPTRVSFPAVAAPIVRPNKVMVTAVLALMTTFIVMTIDPCGDVAVGAAQLPVGGPLPLKAAVGVAVLAKNPDGKASVMLLPTDRAPPAVLVKEKVTAANVLPATRSDVAI